MPAIIKNDFRILNSDSFKQTLVDNPTYVFLSGTSPWPNEGNPPAPIDSVQEENRSLSDIIGLKRVMPNDIISVIPRIDWTQNTIFDQYDHRVNLIDDHNPATGNRYKFYVVTDEMNVYKCLSNSYRSASTHKPSGTAPEPFQTPDGYIWKYMYTIQPTDAFKFLTENWMPCYTLTYNNGTPQWNSQQSAIPGTIDNIDIVLGGAGYRAEDPPTVSIQGDGSGAEAIAIVDPGSGSITDIVVTNSGSGYSFATVTITDNNGPGLGASTRVTIGPRLGHGANPRVELGATNLMVKVTIDGSEFGNFQTNVDYRVSGLLHLPGTVPDGLAIKVGVGQSKLFRVGEKITGSETETTADIKFIDYSRDILYVSDVSWSFSQTEHISSNPYNSSQIDGISSGFMPLTSILDNGDGLAPATGSVLYISNREKISRSNDRKEDIIMVISF